MVVEVAVKHLLGLPLAQDHGGHPNIVFCLGDRPLAKRRLHPIEGLRVEAGAARAGQGSDQGEHDRQDVGRQGRFGAAR